MNLPNVLGARMNYLNFDLAIHPAKDGYRAYAKSPDGKAAEMGFRNPFSEAELSAFWETIGDLSRQTRGQDRGSFAQPPEASLAKAKDIGGRLFAAAFSGLMQECLRSGLDEASRQNAGLRIRLRLTDVPELATLPWEYIYYQPGNRFFAFLRETAIVRYLELMEEIPLFPIPHPLSILVMIGSHEGLDVQQEWQKLENIFG